MDDKPTRLWLSSPHFYPTYGGAQNRYRGYIPGFLQRGLDVRVMAGTPQIHERSEADGNADWYREAPGTWLPPTSVHGAPLERVRLPDDDNSNRISTYYNGLLEVCQRPCDEAVVLQLLTNLRPAAFPWIRRLKKSGTAVLYSISQYPKWPQKPIKHLYRRAGYRRVYNQFDALVTNSQSIEAFLRDIGVTTRIEYIPNGVNLQRFHPACSADDQQAAAEVRRRLGIPPDHDVIATVGAIMPRKGQDKVVKAWRQLLAQFPNTHLLIIGPRSDPDNPKLAEFNKDLTGLIESSGAGDQVHFTGMVDNVESWLRASDIFILASSREGTPNSVLEAMATGLPCVVTPYTGISSGIGKAGEHYQLVERNPDDIATALSSLLGDPLQRRKQGERGQRFVAEHADQSHSLDRYAGLYQELGEISSARRRQRTRWWRRPLEFSQPAAAPLPVDEPVND